MAEKKVIKVKKAVKVVKPTKSASKTADVVVTGVTVPVVDVEGKAKGKMKLSDKLFNVPINKALLAQSVRVYLANQRQGTASTKTRGEVEGSTRKIYRQKGTGRARHGSIRAPIFVGGGIVFGPVPHSYHLDLPVGQKRLALASALTSQLQSGNIIVVDGLSDLEPKTKLVAKALTSIGANTKTLLITAISEKKLILASRNLDRVALIPAQNLNSYIVISAQKLVFTKEAITVLEKTFVK